MLIGEVLVSYYRNLFSALNALKDVFDVYVFFVNLIDCCFWCEFYCCFCVIDDVLDVVDDVDCFFSREIVGCGRFKRNIGFFVCVIFCVFECCGGVDVLVNIKY